MLNLSKIIVFFLMNTMTVSHCTLLSFAARRFDLYYIESFANLEKQKNCIHYINSLVTYLHTEARIVLRVDDDLFLLLTEIWNNKTECYFTYLFNRTAECTSSFYMTSLEGVVANQTNIVDDMLISRYQTPYYLENMCDLGYMMEKSFKRCVNIFATIENKCLSSMTKLGKIFMPGIYGNTESESWIIWFFTPNIWTILSIVLVVSWIIYYKRKLHTHRVLG
ncbi:uncharacterized protein LOC114332201 [Diabrotica virgifera virgifera]|uniref:Uncharacterized protein LOC114332201 n=1 Tax=Diabrotica virgifera virgifera TaxID=50390 RepID=A0A6P7FY57_DIAVI|nr:uncharacterized protein LOC114332201 [Diabrotica virgifera virgifera]